MPRWQDLENQMGQAGQAVQQAGQNFINTNVDQPAAAKLAALQAASASAGGQMGGAPNAGMPMPPPQMPMGAPPAMGGGAPGGSNPGAGTMDDMQAYRQKLLDIQNAASAEKAAAAQQDNLSGYSQVPTQAQLIAAQQQNPRFQKLHQKMAQGHPINKQDIRDLNGAQDEDESNGQKSVQTARNP